MRDAPRVLFAPGEIDAAPGAVIELDGDRLHYLRSVMRLREGQPVTVIAAGHPDRAPEGAGQWAAVIERLGRSSGALRLSNCQRPWRPEPGPALLFAPIRRQRLDWLIEKAVELGASELVPVITERTQHRLGDAGKLRRRIIEAAEQCERLSLPTLREEADLRGVVEGCDRPILWARERSLERPSGQNRPPALLIGPEGGFSPAETEWLAQQTPIVAVSLGPRVLRSETAAIAMLARWTGEPETGGDASM